MLLLQAVATMRSRKKDVDTWRTRLGNRPGVVYKTDPLAGHTFVEGEAWRRRRTTSARIASRGT